MAVIYSQIGAEKLKLKELQDKTGNNKRNTKVSEFIRDKSFSSRRETLI